MQSVKIASIVAESKTSVSNRVQMGDVVEGVGDGVETQSANIVRDICKVLCKNLG